MIQIILNTRPISKARPRISKSGHFYTPSTKEENKLKEMIKEKYHGSLLSSDVSVELSFHFKDKKIGDIDNYEKAVLDCLQGTVLNDDNQIKKLCSEIVQNGNNYISIKITEVIR